MRKVLPHEIADMDESEFLKLNEGLVYNVCHRIYNDKIKNQTGLEYEDLAQVGKMALIRAKRGFDISLGYAFTTYAMPKIWGEVMRHILLHNKVHVPRPVRDAFYKISRAEMYGEDDETIAAALNIPIKNVARARFVRNDISSLDAPMDEEEGDTSFGEFLTDNVSAGEVAENRLTIEEFLGTLKPMERKVWEVYRDTNCGNQVDIARMVGISQPQVGRLLRSVHEKAERFGKRIGVKN